LREARAAASVRHTNVASVFHLGKSGENYFYTMEFVEGETLESLIKRSGQLEIKLALEITSQVAAGLSRQCTIPWQQHHTRQRVGRDNESQLGQRIALKKFIVKLLNLGPCCIHLTDRVIYLVSGGTLPKFGHHFIDRGLAFIPST
jgi:hypothetical protein